MKWFAEYVPASVYFGPRTYRSHEDGFVYHDWPEGWVIVAWSDYGREYVHKHRPATAEAAEAFLAKVQARFEQGGQPDLEHWDYQRVQYGSQAYLDEEPYIVCRERQDDLGRS